ncbi:hypothetical protein AK812_SmicGene15607 [Symbiodinium microadriaticum]|uniref:Uncharacterized protein n=1 Tax=Symbiodinium microadriaticum TaxID=2951 RepID=A0A1Q9E2L8_SYMMI|nr:hypothetical protein AK812_SmicGene15607 [Symbiodinium microadriaticum]
MQAVQASGRRSSIPLVFWPQPWTFLACQVEALETVSFFKSPEEPETDVLTCQALGMRRTEGLSKATDEVCSDLEKKLALGQRLGKRTAFFERSRADVLDNIGASAQTYNLLDGRQLVPYQFFGQIHSPLRGAVYFGAFSRRRGNWWLKAASCQGAGQPDYIAFARGSEIVDDTEDLPVFGPATCFTRQPALMPVFEPLLACAHLFPSSVYAAMLRYAHVRKLLNLPALPAPIRPAGAFMSVKVWMQPSSMVESHRDSRRGRLARSDMYCRIAVAGT